MSDGDDPAADGDDATDDDDATTDGDAATDDDDATTDGDAATDGDDATTDGDAATADGDAATADNAATVTVHHDGEVTEVSATPGEPLRDALLRAGLSPYTRLTARANCGGRGLCATCGVRLRSEQPPDHWHDRLADRFGYPRLSCQVPVSDGLTVALVTDKLVWGGRE